MNILPQLRGHIRNTLQAVGRIRPLVPVLYHPSVSRVLVKMPGAGALYGDGWHRRHPFDRENGTDTSGIVTLEALRSHTNDAALAHAGMYAGSQPSVIRAALDALPPLTNATFIDLGCGKGRPLLVAGERPFRELVGVDLSPQLTAVALANSAIIRARHPERAPIRTVVGDAAGFPLPSGDVVVFLYNPFGAPLMARLRREIERAVQAERRGVYLVYYNPVHGDVFDASPLLTRRWARLVPYASDERGYGPDMRDAVVIWQGGDAPAPVERADARIVVTVPDRRAELVD
jgi:SAM-dependent methyltransferase